MNPETAADTIRRAAALIRQRAEAATPGPWAVSSQGAGARQDWYVTSPSHGLVSTGTHEGEGDFLAIERDHRDAEHIASWHPLPALAAAMMLEAAAAEMDDYGPDSAIHDVPVWTAAHDLARAYLGEVPRG